MLRAWLEARGWKPSANGYSRVTENGYAELDHLTVEAMISHRPELFAHYIRACEVSYMQAARVGMFVTSPAAFAQ